MASYALAELRQAISEIEALQKANPSPQSHHQLTRPEVTRAIGRAEVVLLCSHYERYIRSINQEAMEHAVAVGVTGDQLPEIIRLRHSDEAIGRLAATQWNNRSQQLRTFASEEAPLWWARSTVTSLDHERILRWMKTPSCKDVRRFYEMWGVPDIFKAITRKQSTLRDFLLRLDELVEKRNNIAHGDMTVEATHLDVWRYRAAVRDFATRADKVMSRHLRNLFVGGAPW